MDTARTAVQIFVEGRMSRINKGRHVGDEKEGIVCQQAFGN